MTFFYNREKRTELRHEADKILAAEVMQRFHSKYASLGEKLAALSVPGAMKTKVELGMGLKSRKTQRQQVIKKC